MRAKPGLKGSSVVAMLIVAGCTRKTPPPATDRSASADAAPGPAAARPHSTDAGLAMGARATHDYAIAEGRKHFRAKDYEAAAASFTLAADAVPADADAWSELGWAAFNAGDLTRAEEATRKSLARTGTNAIRGATLYNLGRIDEARHHDRQAEDDYVASLRARPNRIVLERLRTLNPMRAQAMAPLSIAACAGPFPTVAAFCAQLPAEDATGKKPLCAEGKSPFERIDGPKVMATVAPPYLGVAIQTAYDPMNDEGLDNTGPGTETLYLLIRTTAGIFASAPLTRVDNPGAFGISQSATITRLSLQDDSSAPSPDVVVEIDHAAMDQNMGGAEWDAEDAHLLTVCGLGTSGCPACTATTLTAIETSHDFDATELTKDDLVGIAKPYDQSYTLAFTFTGDGNVTFTKAEEKHAALIPPPEEIKALLGSHELRFP